MITKNQIAADFLAVGRELRKEGKTDREIIAAFRAYKRDVEAREVRKADYEAGNISTVAPRILASARGKMKRGKAVIFQFLEKHGQKYSADINFMGAEVDFIINDKLVMDIDRKSSEARQALIAKRGYVYLSMSDDLIRAFPGMARQKINSALVEAGKWLKTNKK